MRLTVYAAGPQGKHTLMHAAALKHSPCMCRTNINCLCLCPLALHGELTPMSWRYGCLCSHTHPALAPGLLRSTHARSPVRPDFLLPRLSLPSINTHQSAPLPPLPDWLRQDLRLPAALAGQLPVRPGGGGKQARTWRQAQGRSRDPGHVAHTRAGSTDPPAGVEKCGGNGRVVGERAVQIQEQV